MIVRIHNLLLVALFTALWLKAGAQPEQLHLSWSGNHVRTSSSITLCWNSEDSILREFVDFGTHYSKHHMVKAKKTVANGMAFSKVRLDDLQPSTTYTYRCGSNQTGWSENYTYTTAPLPGTRKAFKVAVWGDSQNNEMNEQFEKTIPIIAQINLLNPNFSLHMGDMVNNGAITSDWLKWLKVAQPLNSISPLMPTLGNHDIENQQGENFQQPFTSFHYLFSLPGNGVDYSFDYDNTHFVCIFSGMAQKAAENGLLRYAVHSKEARWLEKDLAKARRNPRIDWIIAFTHYPVHSFGGSNVVQWGENLAPILEKYQVDLCLSGHRHVYERHHALKSGQISRDGKGTVYITNGTAGGSPQGLGGNELSTIAFTSTEKMYNYAFMTIEGKNLKYQVFDIDNNKIDELILSK